MNHTIKPVDKLTLHDINALAKRAYERGESLEQANVYEGHIGAAFEGAYLGHAGAYQVEVVTA